MELKIKKVTILSMQCHPDVICFDIENLSTPFPKLQEQEITTFELRCAKGYAEQWCKLNNVVVDEIVHA
jgi:hypothetical protein